MPYNESTKAQLQSWVDNDYQRIKLQVQQGNFVNILQDIENIKMLADEILYEKPQFQHDQGGG